MEKDELHEQRHHGEVFSAALVLFEKKIQDLTPILLYWTVHFWINFPGDLKIARF